MSTFHRTSGTESPARPTASLIFNWCYAASLNPIYRVYSWGLVFIFSTSFIRRFEATHDSKFVFSPGRKLVVPNCESVLWFCVLCHNGFVSLDEDSLSLGVLCKTCISEIVFSNVPHEKEVSGGQHLSKDKLYLILIFVSNT